MCLEIQNDKHCLQKVERVACLLCTVFSGDVSLLLPLCLVFLLFLDLNLQNQVRVVRFHFGSLVWITVKLAYPPIKAY